MKITRLTCGLILAAAIVFMMSFGIPSAFALDGGGYHLDWYTYDSGGGKSSSTEYRLVGSVGQPDACLALEGGSYRLSGGYWSDNLVRLFLPLIMK